MPFLSIRETTLDALNLHRYPHETDDQLINRLLEHARSNMIIVEATPTEIPRLEIQLQKVLGVVSEWERIYGVSKDEDLFDALLQDHGLNRTESARLIGVLLKDGTLYSPRPGFYKRTSPEVGV